MNQVWLPKLIDVLLPAIEDSLPKAIAYEVTAFNRFTTSNVLSTHQHYCNAIMRVFASAHRPMLRVLLCSAVRICCDHASQTVHCGAYNVMHAT
jgi:hypothetical protein